MRNFCDRKGIPEEIPKDWLVDKTARPEGISPDALPDKMVEAMAGRIKLAVEQRVVPPEEDLEIPSQMRGVMVPRTGDASVMEYREDLPIPELKDGDVLVKNEFAGLNFIDTYHRSGLYARELPFVVGQEGAGTIVQTTPGAEEIGLATGMRCMYTSFGSGAEFTAVPSGRIIPMEPYIPGDVAAAAVVQGLTAHYLVVDAPAGLIGSGEFMLIHAAAGGTGQLAVQMAKIYGHQVIGTCSPAKTEIAYAAGCDYVIDYTSEDIAERVMELTNGAGAMCVLDGVGKDTAKASIASLGDRGICIFFGNASGPVEPISPLELIKKSNYITRPKLLDYTRDRDEMMFRGESVMKWIMDGDVVLHIDKVLPLSQTAAAHRYIEAGKTTGKILFDISAKE